MAQTTISLLGSGWLGLPLAQHFKQLGFNVNASTRTESRMAELAIRGIQPFQVDLERLTNDIQRFLAAEILIINITSKNIDGFADLISHIEQSPIQKVLFVSSTSVYQNLNRIVDEDEDAEDPASLLFQIENLFRQNPHFQTTILRFSGLIGGNRHPGRFFRSGKVVQQADAPVNLIHLDDCIKLMSEIIQQDCWGQVLNGCADTHPSKREFYSHARQLLGLEPPEFASNNTPDFKVISNNKIKRLLNYQFIHSDLMQIEL